MSTPRRLQAERFWSPVVAGFDRGAAFLSMLGAWLAALLMVYVVFHIAVEVVLRFFSRSTYVLDEFAGYAMGGIVFLSLGYAIRSGAMIRMSMTTRLMSQGLRRAAELLAAGLTLAVTAGATYFFWLGVERNWDRAAKSETVAAIPLWVPESLALVGLIIVSFQLLSYMLQLLVGGPIVESEEGRSE